MLCCFYVRLTRSHMFLYPSDAISYTFDAMCGKVIPGMAFTEDFDAVLAEKSDAYRPTFRRWCRQKEFVDARFSRLAV